MELLYILLYILRKAAEENWTFYNTVDAGAEFYYEYRTENGLKSDTETFHLMSQTVKLPWMM